MVSQREHALQTAYQAVRAESSKDLVVAALLHDVGHLLHDEREDAADHGIDTRHEIAGYEWLRTQFGLAIAEPVKLHVPAKRYLRRAGVFRGAIVGFDAEPGTIGRRVYRRRGPGVREPALLSRSCRITAMGRFGQGAGDACPGAGRLRGSA